MDEIWMKISDAAERNYGFISTAQVEMLGISRPMLKKYVEQGKLQQIRKGLYSPADALPDEYALLQVQSTKAVFAYGTALYLWGMSDRVPHTIDIVVPWGINITRLRRDNPQLRCHYVRGDAYELGITETKSPQGATVRLYDRERCICDLIREKEQIELQLFTQAIKEYFKTKPNNRKLLKYGKVFGIEDKIRIYMEVL